MRASQLGMACSVGSAAANSPTQGRTTVTMPCFSHPPIHTQETHLQRTSSKLQAENLPSALSVWKQCRSLVSLKALNSKAGYPLGEANEPQLDSEMRRQRWSILLFVPRSWILAPLGQQLLPCLQDVQTGPITALFLSRFQLTSTTFV